MTYDCCRHCVRDGDKTASCRGIENTHGSPCRHCLRSNDVAVITVPDPEEDS